MSVLPASISVLILRTWAVSSFGCWENMRKLTPSSCLVSTVPCSHLTRMMRSWQLLGSCDAMWLQRTELWDGSFLNCWFPFSWWRGWGLNQRGCAHDSKGVGLRRPNSCILSVFLSVCVCVSIHSCCTKCLTFNTQGKWCAKRWK